jgi:folate-binding protein YgfZ
MITLNYLAAIRISGTDAGDFLHNQVSADVLALSNHESTFACYCEPRGRVLALLLVSRVDADYYVILSSALAQSVSDRLKIYVMRANVEIGILKDGAVTALQKGVAPELATSFMLAIPVPGSNHWLAITGPDIAADSKPVLCDAWRMSELQRGITWLNPKTSGQFLPQMLGFDQIGAVNYHKGCYPGQEIVARTHYLGKVKRHPRVLTTRETIGAQPLEKIQLHSDGQSHEAIVADSGFSENVGACVFVVTRMDPELVVDQIEYEGKLSAPVPLQEVAIPG